MSFTRSALTEYLSQSLYIDLTGVADDTPLFTSGLADSFSVTDLILFVEKSIGHRLPPEEVIMENFDSIERILALALRQTTGLVRGN